MPLDPALDRFRLPPSDRCWWCGDLATTQEHRIKHSTLRRVARDETGRADPANVFKKSADYEGTLRSLSKGSQVKWHKNMCASCNNARSQPFDRAYDVMDSFIIEHADQMMRWRRLTWMDVYGSEWEEAAGNLGRYFGKQVACMLASQRLPIPNDLIEFLDGAGDCPSVAFRIFRNWRAGNAHRMMLRDGLHDGITSFVGLLPSSAYQGNGRLTGIDFGYHIGYVWFCAEWREGTDNSSWWEHAVIDLPVVNGDALSRLSWKVLQLRQRIARLPFRESG